MVPQEGTRPHLLTERVPLLRVTIGADVIRQAEVEDAEALSRKPDVCLA